MVAFTDECDGEETGGLVTGVGVVVVCREEKGGLEECMPDSSAFDVCIQFNIERREAHIKYIILVYQYSGTVHVHIDNIHSHNRCNVQCMNLLSCRLRHMYMYSLDLPQQLLSM